MARLSTDLTRDEIIAILRERDGDQCMFPGCDKPWGEGGFAVSLDHKFAQHLAKQAGWTREQTDNINNLQLMHRLCNSRKSHHLPDENGNFNIKIREPKVVKGPRPELCDTCYSGRILLIGETCPDCSSGPQPPSAPKAYQLPVKQCPHEGFWHCWMCYLGFIERKSALQTIITGP